MKPASEKATPEIPRQGRVERRTKETQIVLQVGLDGTGAAKVETGIPFFTHMLEAWAKHGLMDLTVDARGDLDVDLHHTVEDVGICLGKAFREALGDKAGIVRYGASFLPMDEALLHAAVDISGRPYLVFNVPLRRARILDDARVLGHHRPHPETPQGVLDAAQIPPAVVDDRDHVRGYPWC